MLNMHAGSLGEHLALPQVAAQNTELIRRSKRACQQTVGVQLLNPLTIENIRFASRDILNVTGIDQLYFETAAFKQFEQRDPINSRRFHGYRGDAALLQPISQGNKIGSEGTKLPHRHFIPAFGHSYHVALRPDINTCGIEVDVLQLLWQTLEVETLRLGSLPAFAHAAAPVGDHFSLRFAYKRRGALLCILLNGILAT